MDEHAKIIRSRGLDDILKHYKPEIPEMPHELTVSGINILYNLLVKYQLLLREQDILHQVRWVNEQPQRRKQVRETYGFMEVLTPLEINAFVQGTIPFEQHPHYAYATGVALSGLIQNSYDAGHNDFELAMVTPIHNLLETVQASESNPLRITIDGSVGQHFAAFSTYLQCTVTGNVGWNCAMSAQHGHFILKRNVAEALAGSTVLTQEPARDCLFEIYGRISGTGDIAAGKECTFIFYQRQAALDAWFLKSNLNHNKIFYQDPQGNREEV